MDIIFTLEYWMVVRVPENNKILNKNFDLGGYSVEIFFDSKLMHEHISSMRE